MLVHTFLLFINVSMCQCVEVSMCRWVNLSMCLYVNVSMCLFLYVYICIIWYNFANLGKLDRITHYICALRNYFFRILQLIRKTYLEDVWNPHVVYKYVKRCTESTSIKKFRCTGLYTVYMHLYFLSHYSINDE
jgi:hypothetical protein